MNMLGFLPSVNQHAKLKISSCDSKVYIVFSGLTVTTDFNIVPPGAEILEAGQPWRVKG
jgi:hypothetical protein